MTKNYIEIDGKEIRVYQLTEDDAVAAEWDTDAVEWYKNLTGLEDDEINSPEDVELVDLDKVILKGEGTDETTTVREVVKEYWTGEPFIAVMSVY